MFLKIIVLLIVVLMGIGMVGKVFNQAKPEDKKLNKTRKCKKCGGYIVGKGPCATCAKKGR